MSAVSEILSNWTKVAVRLLIVLATIALAGAPATDALACCEPARAAALEQPHAGDAADHDPADEAGSDCLCLQGHCYTLGSLAPVAGEALTPSASGGRFLVLTEADAVSASPALLERPPRL